MISYNCWLVSKIGYSTIRNRNAVDKFLLNGFWFEFHVDFIFNFFSLHVIAVCALVSTLLATVLAYIPVKSCHLESNSSWKWIDCVASKKHKQKLLLTILVIWLLTVILMVFRFMLSTGQRIAFHQHRFGVALVLLWWAMALVVNKISNHWKFLIAFTNINVYETVEWFEWNLTSFGTANRFDVESHSAGIHKFLVAALVYLTFSNVNALRWDFRLNYCKIETKMSNYHRLI